MIISSVDKVPLEKCPALVLNADFRPLSYYPLSIWCWQDAVKSVFLDRVSIVSNYKRKIRSPSFEMNLPSVIALKSFIQPSKNPNFTRFNVFLRDKFSCQYCGDKKDLTFDHLLPKSRGGLTDWNNRLRYIIPENQINTIYNLSFDDFLNANGLPENFTKLRSVVFSIQGNYSAFKPFKVEIKSTSFKGAATLGLLDSEISPANTVINYPNPFQSSTTIVLSGLTGFINITVFDMLGRIVDKQRIVTNQNGKNAAYHSSKISRGLFKYIFSDDSNNIYTGTFFKN